MLQNINVIQRYIPQCFVAAISLMLIILFAPFSSADVQALSDANKPASLLPINVQLKWRHQFQFAGYYAAIEQGFYQEAGFDVNLKESNAQINPVDEVLSGRADYGIANSELVLYHLNGEPVMAIAAIIQPVSYTHLPLPPKA